MDKCPISTTAKDLVYWREPIKSGIVMFVMLTALISLSCLSLVSVIAYTGLSLLCCTAAWRVYHEVLGAMKKSGAEGDGTTTKHPFHDWLTCDITLPRDKIADRVDYISARMSGQLNYLRRIVLVSSYLDTIKFGVAMYLLTFVGEWFNLLTLVIIAVVLTFTLPKVYELYKPQIDSGAREVKKRYDAVYNQIMAKLENLPIMRKKPKSS